VSDPLLFCASARIALDGHVLCDDLTLTLQAERGALVGDWSALFELLGGHGRLCAGQVTVAGREPKLAARHGELGIARYDPELVSRWRFVDYLTESGRLTGLSKRDAQRAAVDVQRSLGLELLSAKPLERLASVERRALLIAHSVLTNPAVVALEAPLYRVAEPGRAWLGEVMTRALTGRRWIVSFPELPEAGTEGQAFCQATGAVVLSAGCVVAQGAPADVLAQARSYIVRVARDADRLTAALTEAGLVVTTSAVAERSLELAALPATTFTVALSQDLPSAPQIELILQAADELEVPVLELRPLGMGALSP
jgi:ABC-type Na+ transport system ATPase subunit NatA